MARNKSTAVIQDLEPVPSLDEALEMLRISRSSVEDDPIGAAMRDADLIMEGRAEELRKALKSELTKKG